MLLGTNLSFMFRLATPMYLPVLVVTLATTMLGNLVRSSALFYIEGGLLDAPLWMHSAVGVVAFVFTSLGVVFVVKLSSEVKWRS